MLMNRMQRKGSKNEPQFRIVVGEHTMGPKSGKFLEKLGSFNPKTDEKTLDVERVKYWMSHGAQVSPRIHNILVDMGITKGKKINVLPQKVLAKVEAPAAEVATAPEAAPVA